MTQRLVVANYKTGYETDVEPFLVNNDAFPILQDAQIYVGRARRKRGTYPLGRLGRTVTSTQSLTGGTTNLVATVSFPSGAPNATVSPEGLDAHVDFAITGATQANPCVLTVTGNTFVANQFVTISDVEGMTELNGNTYEITNVTGAAVTINVDSTGFSAYTSGGIAAVYGQIYRTITGISNASSAVVTSNNHNIPDGSTVLITGVSGIYLPFTITGITNANPMVVTADNTAKKGDLVTFSGVNGMVGVNNQSFYVIDATPTTMTFQANSKNFGTYTSGGTALDISQNPLNNLLFTTSAATTNTFTINVDTTNYSAYISGGTASTLTDLLTGSNSIQFNPAFSGDSTVTVDVYQFTNLPVMGIEDYDIAQPLAAPINVFFDTMFAYQFNSGTNQFYSVSFYKSSGAPVTWSGQNYQQFWSTNFQGAFWATNNNPGNIFTYGTYTSGTGTPTVTFNIKTASAGSNVTTLVVGDYLFFNEWPTTGGNNINLTSGVISDATGAAAGNYVVTFASATTVSGNGYIQLLTNSLAGRGDGIRWYDGSATPTQGWVNFAPPLSNAASPLYLAGALMIYPYKDRLLFFNCVATNSQGSQTAFIDTVIYSQNGTVYYSNPVPINQTVDAMSFFSRPAGKGGYARTGLNQQLVSLAPNEDLLIIGSEYRKVRLIYTNIDANPFLFDTINIEFTTSATFSAVSLDVGILDIGTYGIVLTTPATAQRVDLPIFQQIFDDFNQQNNGYERINGARDWYEEYIYWSYVSNAYPTQWLYPTRTLAYGYRDKTWAYFNESFTHYGIYRPNVVITWGTYNATWSNASIKWGYGGGQANFPEIACGNQQGYVVRKLTTGTGETYTRYIDGVTINADTTTINCPDHCLNEDFIIYFNNLTGIVGLNGTLQTVSLIESSPGVYDKDNFNIDIVVSGTYVGGGEIIIVPDPQIQTKSFNFMWEGARKTRFGTQRFFMTNSANGKVSIANYVNQNYSVDVNAPFNLEENSSNLASNILFTSPETDNPVVQASQQIWHRMSNSFIGDTIATKIYLSQDQRLDPSLQTQFAEIEMHAFVMDVHAGPNLDYYLE